MHDEAFSPVGRNLPQASHADMSPVQTKGIGQAVELHFICPERGSCHYGHFCREAKSWNAIYDLLLSEFRSWSAALGIVHSSDVSPAMLGSAGEGHRNSLFLSVKLAAPTQQHPCLVKEIRKRRTRRGRRLKTPPRCAVVFGAGWPASYRPQDTWTVITSSELYASDQTRHSPDDGEQVVR